MTLWFLWLAALGIYRLAQHPQVLRALSPGWGLQLVQERPAIALVILGAVILALTGAEALYADIGHFGRRPMRVAWLSVVFPSIIPGNFGQGATLLYEAGPKDQPFFAMAPGWVLIPTIVIALLATIIASQAVISGAFSMTSQAIELGFLPRMRVVETSREQRGLVYVPAVNLVLFAAVMFLVLTFHSSARLTYAYGIAVGLTMLTTTIQMISLSRRVWHWPRGCGGRGQRAAAGDRRPAGGSQCAEDFARRLISSRDRHCDVCADDHLAARSRSGGAPRRDDCTARGFSGRGAGRP
jgi:KUP system potassium uptake protein